MSRTSAFLLALAVSLAASAPGAGAAPITFAFSGVIYEVSPTLVGIPISLGDPVSGAYTFESTTPDGDASGTAGSYDAIISFTVTAGGYTTTLGPPSEITVNDAGIIDLYAVTGDPTASMGFDFDFLTLLAYDNAPLVGGVDGDALPLVPPDPADFDAVDFQLHLGGEILVRGDITSMSLVPEPGATLLVAGSLALLGVARRQMR